MKITYLGTGTSQGVPVVACSCEVCTSADPFDTRLRSSVFVQSGGISFTIDAGPDFRAQMLREKVTQLDAVLITHAHKDHIGGLDDVRAFNYVQKKPMDVFASSVHQEAIIREFYYAFTKFKYPGVPQINLQTISNEKFIIGDLEITPIQTMHYQNPVFGFRIKDFTYITDANYISDEERNKIRGTKVLSINALRKKKHISHFNLEEALAVIKDINPEQAYLCHISHLMGKHSDVEKELPDNVKIAYDGLSFQLDDKG